MVLEPDVSIKHAFHFVMFNYYYLLHLYACTGQALIRVAVICVIGTAAICPPSQIMQCACVHVLTYL